MGFGYAPPLVPPEPLSLLGELTCNGIQITGNTAGTGSTVSTEYGYQGAPDVAFTLTLTEPKSITVSTCGSSYDTHLHLFTADGDMLGEQIASCDDCGSCDSNNVHAILSSLDGSLPPTLQAGIYMVVIDGYGSDAGEFVLSCTEEETVESSGFILGSIPCDGIPIPASTIGAANNVSTGLQYEAPDVAFSFTLSLPSRIELSTCASYFDTFLHLYSANGDELDESLQTCDDCQGCGYLYGYEGNEILTTPDFLPPGDYFVVVDGYQEAGNFFLTCSKLEEINMSPPPAPLTFLGTLECDGLPVSGSTAGSGSTVNHDGYSFGPDVAYAFTLSEPSAIELSTCDSGFDTWLHLYTANGQLLGEQIGSCDDCGQCEDSESHSILSSADGSLPNELPAGDYLVVVDGYFSQSGDFQLACSLLPPYCDNCVVYSSDSNCDGTVDILDVVALLNHITGNTLLGACEALAADSDATGELNVLDAVTMIINITG